MRTILKFFIISLVAAVLVVWLADNPGEVRLIWLGFEVQSSIAFMLAVFAGIIGAGWLFVSIFRRISSVGRAHHS